MREALINERLQWKLDPSGVLPEQMAEFHRDRCTIDSVLDLVTFVEGEWHQGSMSVAVFLDIRRAFDLVVTDMFCTVS